MIKKQLDILKKNYLKKNRLLDSLFELGEKQLELLQQSVLQLDEFDQTMEEQDDLVSQLNQLEGETSSLCADLKDELKQNRSSYQAELKEIQELVSTVQKKVAGLSAQEKEIKEKTAVQLNGERSNLKGGRQSSKAAMDYYKTMSGSHVVPAHFMDQKQ